MRLSDYDIKVLAGATREEKGSKGEGGRMSLLDVDINN